MGKKPKLREGAGEWGEAPLSRELRKSCQFQAENATVQAVMESHLSALAADMGPPLALFPKTHRGNPWGRLSGETQHSNPNITPGG